MKKPLDPNSEEYQTLALALLPPKPEDYEQLAEKFKQEHKKVLKLKRENRMLNELITALDEDKVSLQNTVTSLQEEIQNLHRQVYHRRD